MAATNATFWFWSDWLGDQAVRRLTLAERGLWIDLLALAAVGKPIGYVCDDRGRPLTLDDIARVSNAGGADEVAKMIESIVDKGAASRDRSGRLFNRRMVRDAEKDAKKAALSVKRALAGKIGAESTSLRYFKNPSLPQHVPRQLPRHLPQQSLVSPNQSKNNFLPTAVVRNEQSMPGGAASPENDPESPKPQRRRRPTDREDVASPELLNSLRKRGIGS